MDTTRKQIKDYKAEGLNNNQIAQRLGVSRQYVGKVLRCKPNVNQCKPQDVNHVNQECKPRDGTGQHSQSVADLKIKLNTLLKKLYIRLDTIEKRQEDIQEDFNSRADKVIKYYIQNTLGAFIEQKLNKLREEFKEQLKN